jgi:hypothetical protein
MFAKITVWMFVALILFVDGLIIVGAGIYNWHADGVKEVAPYHPSVVWGVLMIVFSLFFMWVSTCSRSDKD